MFQRIDRSGLTIEGDEVFRFQEGTIGGGAPLGERAECLHFIPRPLKFFFAPDTHDEVAPERSEFAIAVKLDAECLQISYKSGHVPYFLFQKTSNRESRAKCHKTVIGKSAIADK
ncbi:MAG: hypothetical protein R3F19_01135 [Verrucomicrobiales bacterium]